MTPGEGDSPNDELFTALLDEEKEIDGELKKTKKSSKKKSEPAPPRISYYDDTESGILYLTAIEGGRNYVFVCEELGRIVTKPDLMIDGRRYLPQRIPEINGVPTDAVLVPRVELLANIPLLSPDDLSREIKTHITRYFDAPPLEIDVFVYYILFSWFYPKCRVAPILRFLADLGSGKSRGMDVVGDLCFYRMRLDGGTTASSIMRLKQQWQGTCVMDEADLKADSRSESGGFEDIMGKFFNLGFEKGRYILKTSQNDFSVQEVYDPFGPKVLGMRAPFKDSAIESRCLNYSPRETTRTDIPYVLPSTYFEERDQLVAKLARFTLHHWPNVDGNDFIDVSTMAVDSRTKQFSLPLSFVVKQLYPCGEQEYRRYINQRYAEIRRIRATSEEGVAFNTLYALAIGEISVKNDFPALYNSEGLPLRVTPAMMAKVYGWTSSYRITNKLTRILHFEKRRQRIGIKTEWVILVPSVDIWKSAFQRYYFNEDDENQSTFSDIDSEIPPALSWVCSNVPSVPKSGEGRGYASDDLSIYNKKFSKVGLSKSGTIGTDPVENSDTLSPRVVGTSGTLEQSEITTPPRSNCSKISDDSDLAQFLKFAGLASLPHIPLYHRMTPDERRRFGRCIVAGCENPKMYCDHTGAQFLCEPHFLMLKQKFFSDQDQAGGDTHA